MKKVYICLLCFILVFYRAYNLPARNAKDEEQTTSEAAKTDKEKKSSDEGTNTPFSSAKEVESTTTPTDKNTDDSFDMCDDDGTGDDTIDDGDNGDDGSGDTGDDGNGDDGTGDTGNGDGGTEYNPDSFIDYVKNGGDVNGTYTYNDDGSISTTNSDGSVVTFNTDGSVSVTDSSDGSTLTLEGQTITVDDNGRVTVSPSESNFSATYSVDGQSYSFNGSYNSGTGDVSYSYNDNNVVVTSYLNNNVWYYNVGGVVTTTPPGDIPMNNAIQNYLNENESNYVTLSPKHPITNITQEMQCFNKNAGAKLTIYVDQPAPGKRDASYWFDVGHSFISIDQQNANGQNITRVLGFYPDGSANPITPNKPSILGNDGGHEYDVSITIQLSSADFSSIYDFIMGYKAQNDGNYGLNAFNCTNFAYAIAELAGINLPITVHYWPFGQGMDPGDFGEDLMQYYGNNGNTPATRASDGTTAPSDTGSCN